MIRFRPAVRADTPLIIGIAGPTKSGKTFSAHRVAAGIANGSVVAMLNAEGARGHQYADRFAYVAHDLTPPFSPASYTEAVKAAGQLNPAALIIDSMSHMHDGPGGMLEMHDDELERMAGGKSGRERQAYTWSAWIKPKRDENEFIYTMLSLACPVILCFRAKEKLKIVRGKEPIDLGWQPISSDRVAFETLFTVLLPPHSKGVPDLSISEMREPFDTMISATDQLDEAMGRKLATWAKGKSVAVAQPGEHPIVDRKAEGSIPSGGANSAPFTYPHVIENIKAARTRSDFELIGDLIRTWPDEQQRAELDVEARAAWKKLKQAAA